jgi:hypothetical protein
MEAQILEVVRDLVASGQPLALKGIASWFLTCRTIPLIFNSGPRVGFSRRSGRSRTARQTSTSERSRRKWVGNVIRRKLQLRPARASAGYVIPPEEFPKVDRLYGRYGVASGTGEAEPTAATPEPDFP